MLPLKMQSRSKTQPERPWMSEPGLFVGRKAHQPSESVNQAKNQSRERQQLQRSGPRRPVAQSFAAPLKTEVCAHRFRMPGYVDLPDPGEVHVQDHGVLLPPSADHCWFQQSIILT